MTILLSGCGVTVATFTANDRLHDKIEIKSQNPIKSIYLEFAKPTGKIDKNDQISFEDFKNILKKELENKGYALVSSSEGADLVLKLKPHFYEKGEGEYYILPKLPLDYSGHPYRKVGSVNMTAVYITDEGKWSKVYRACGRFGKSCNPRLTHPLTRIPHGIISDLGILNNSVQSYYERGLQYYHTGDYNQAIADFTRAIEIDPNFADAYHRRGEMYFSKKDYDKSWEDIHKAQSLGNAIPRDFLNKLKEASGREQ